jgi:cytochrome bd-type quinol oxidase subunit 2
VKAVDWADDHPGLAAVSFAIAVFVVLHIWSALHDGSLLLARADPDSRLQIYGQIGASAVAILGVSLTVLAILLALPDRPAIADIRDSDTWPRLRGLLLVIALLAFIGLVSAQIGAAVDNQLAGCEFVEQIVIASAVATVTAMGVAGVTFWLVLQATDEPSDPSRGRGQGRYP